MCLLGNFFKSQKIMKRKTIGNGYSLQKINWKAICKHFYIYLVCGVGGWMLHSPPVEGGLRSACGNQFSPSTTWVLRPELKSSGLADKFLYLLSPLTSVA